MPHLVFRVLDVGQGSANIIELREKEDILNTIVIDLGTSRGMSVSDGPTADAMFTLLNSMDDPKIGALVLSHSDSDHINLIKPVLDRFAPPGPRVPGRKNLEISWVRYGGPADKYVHEDPITKEKTNVIELVKSYCLNKAEVQGIPFADTSFAPPRPWLHRPGVSRRWTRARSTHARSSCCSSTTAISSL
jgi:glyoxylase-like metal-dependent hydrolase (beta-lactamase superfamily II)